MAVVIDGENDSVSVGRSLKVMHVEAGRHLYGGALQVFYLMRGLHQRGVENILVCPPGSDIGRESAAVATVEEVSLKGDLDIGFVGRLSKLIRLHQPDILHVHSRRGADVWGALAARRTGVKAILTRRVDNPENRLLARFKAKRYDRLVAISEGIRQVMIQCGVAPEQVRTVHSAVDSEKYSPHEKTDVLATRFGIPEDALTLAVIAQLIERKGHRFLLQVLPDILAETPNVYVLILGKGPNEQVLREQVTSLNLTERVIFAGFQTDVEKLLPQVDVVVHPALMEGLGVALLQASACAVPIVASNAGGMPEIVHDGENGFLMAPGDANALKGYVQQLVSDASLRQRFGEAGRRIVEASFSIDAMVEGNLSGYHELMAEQ